MLRISSFLGIVAPARAEEPGRKSRGSSLQLKDLGYESDYTVSTDSGISPISPKFGLLADKLNRDGLDKMADDARKKEIEERVENAVNVAYELSTAVESEDVDNTVRSLQRAARLIQGYKYNTLVVPQLLEVLSMLLGNEELMHTSASVLRITANILENPRFFKTISTSLELVAKSFENEVVNTAFQNAVSVANKVIENEMVHTQVSKGVHVAKRFYDSKEGQQISKNTMEVAKAILQNSKVKSSLKMANTVIADPRVHKVGKYVSDKVDAVASSRITKTAVNQTYNVANSFPVKTSLNLTSTVATKVITSKPVKLATSAGVSIVSHPSVTGIVTSSANTAANVATSTPVTKSFQYTSAAAMAIWRNTAAPGLRVGYNFAGRIFGSDESKTQLAYEKAQEDLNALESRKLELVKKADELNQKLNPILEEISAIERQQASLEWKHNVLYSKALVP